MENKRFYTATDVKELLNVSLSYAYKLIWEKYNEASRQGVNDKKVRELRTEILAKLLLVE